MAGLHGAEETRVMLSSLVTTLAPVFISAVTVLIPLQLLKVQDRLF